ncbi:GCN5-related N-acetyltransferase (modular protein) [uncultured Pleomorphomonas sp.]|uniref:GCN5-related N-acetyltransferase (Modular protein) n=2 Tax=uncultured Pleomorphomonas sp. TaxID=442121 RepID=A0A212LKE8_9HYPH|nr:GCN5-related N-acetyltransferase (modular protein) [uncultured Pleomorphomonas sp.]
MAPHPAFPRFDMTAIDLSLARSIDSFALEDVAFRPEMVGDAAAIDAIHDVTFGPGRYSRTAFRLREGHAPDGPTSLVAAYRENVIGSVRLTAIAAGEKPALLLGPLAVLPALKNLGVGKALMRLSMEAARQRHHRLVVLVGDLPYYWPFGFRVVPAGRLQLPGPVDPARLLWAELTSGASDGVAGPVRAVRPNI